MSSRLFGVVLGIIVSYIVCVSMSSPAAIPKPQQAYFSRSSSKVQIVICSVPLNIHFWLLPSWILSLSKLSIFKRSLMKLFGPVLSMTIIYLNGRS